MSLQIALLSYYWISTYHLFDLFQFSSGAFVFWQYPCHFHHFQAAILADLISHLPKTCAKSTPDAVGNELSDKNPAVFFNVFLMIGWIWLDHGNLLFLSSALVGLADPEPVWLMLWAWHKPFGTFGAGWNMYSYYSPYLLLILHFPFILIARFFPLYGGEFHVPLSEVTIWRRLPVNLSEWLSTSRCYLIKSCRNICKNSCALCQRPKRTVWHCVLWDLRSVVTCKSE